MWQEHEQRQREWNEVDGENWEVDSRTLHAIIAHESTALRDALGVYSRRSPMYLSRYAGAVLL